MNPKRCVNIDWLELYCLESGEAKRDASFFRDKGWLVRERDYGTRQYREMFTLLDNDNHPFIEVRRNPVSADGAGGARGIFSPYSCHIRLTNRYCYAENAVQLVTEFLQRYEYEVQRLYRLDLCLDFEKFDYGDNPADFIARYMKHKYVKINQCKIHAHGTEQWSNVLWNSLSWGNPLESMVSTKLYNKTLELKDNDKPYIRYAWFAAGLVPNWQQIGRDIWRVEFSIRSAARGWYQVEDCNGNKIRTMKKEHTLSTYATREDQVKAFFSLAYYYFHFKHYKEGVRKDRLEDKKLFNYHGIEVYRLDRLLTDDKAVNSPINRFRQAVENYRASHYDKGVQQACDVILESIGRDFCITNEVTHITNAEVQLMQQLIARRISHADKETFQQSLDIIRDILKEGNSTLF